jgi:hypothetical protein
MHGVFRSGPVASSVYYMICLGHTFGDAVCTKPRVHNRVFCEVHVKLSRFAYLSGYALRNDAEEAEVNSLKDELDILGLGDHSWHIVTRE